MGEAFVFVTQACQLGGRRIPGRPAPMPRLQCFEFTALPLPAPAGQMRGVEAFPAQEGTQGTRGGAAGVGLPQYPQLVTDSDEMVVDVP